MTNERFHKVYLLVKNICGEEALTIRAQAVEACYSTVRELSK